MTWELICDACGQMIPIGLSFIEDGNHIFCNENCKNEYWRI